MGITGGDGVIPFKEYMLSWVAPPQASAELPVQVELQDESEPLLVVARVALSQ